MLNLLCSNALDTNSVVKCFLTTDIYYGENYGEDYGETLFFYMTVAKNAIVAYGISVIKFSLTTASMSLKMSLKMSPKIHKTFSPFFGFFEGIIWQRLCNSVCNRNGSLDCLDARIQADWWAVTMGILRYLMIPIFLPLFFDFILINPPKHAKSLAKLKYFALFSSSICIFQNFFVPLRLNLLCVHVCAMYTYASKQKRTKPVLAPQGKFENQR